MLEQTFDPKGQKTYRPLFLTLLCLITFIGSVAGIIINARGYVKAAEEVQNITAGKVKTQLKNLFNSDYKNEPAPEGRIGNLTEENYKKFCIGCIASSILCLVGTILIFKLKRTGFYSFTLGTFFNLITHFLLFGDKFGFMGISILAALAGFVFVILFGMNLKYLEEA